MSKWFDVTSKGNPNRGEVVLVYVPDFCQCGLTVATYHPDKKVFEDQQYGDVTQWVKKWTRISPILK